MKNFLLSTLRLSLIMGIPLLISCTEELESFEKRQSSADSFAFSISTDSGENASILNNVGTRGALATTASLSAGFGVSCAAYPSSGTYTSYGHGSYFYKIQAMPDTPTPYYWPTSDYKVSFFAYYPYGNSAFTVQSAATSTGSPTYAYTVPSDVMSHIDIMTAERTDMSCTTHPTVNLSFSHRLSNLWFRVYNQNPNESLTVNSITVTGVKYAGTLTGSTWTLTGSANTSSSHPITQALSTTVAGGATTDVTGTDGHFMLLPQTVAAGTQLLVVNTTEYGSSRTYTHELENSLTLQAGKSYLFTLKLGDGLLIVDAATSVTDWDPQTQNVTDVNSAINIWQ